MNGRHQKDIEFGNYYEKKVIEFLNKNNYKDEELKFYKNPYSTMDMCNSKNICELKTRRINHKQYPDMMIGLNKIEEAEKDKKYEKFDFWYYFLCKDGLYGWRYRPQHNLSFRIGGRTDRGKDERKMCAFIPTNELSCISTEINSIS